MIEVARVSKDFGGTSALREVTFSVERGAITGLLGPNGSGKTTLMRILAGFFPPTTGQVRVAGCDAAQQALALRRKIGYLPENVVLYPEMRVRRFLEFCADVRGLERRRRTQCLERVVLDCGLQEVSNRRMGTLSKGYRQRVGLAQALLHEPEVLILDEPTVGLDPGQVVEFRGLIRALRGHKTVLLSTHIVPEIDLTCDRVIIIDRGRIVAEDSTQALSRRIGGTQRTVLRVEGPAEAIGDRLRRLPGVDRVEALQGKDAGDSGVAEFMVFSRAGEAVPKAIAAAVVAQGWGLIEVRPSPPGLEELFVRLVDHAAPGAVH